MAPSFSWADMKAVRLAPVRRRISQSSNLAQGVPLRTCKVVAVPPDANVGLLGVEWLDRSQPAFSGSFTRNHGCLMPDAAISAADTCISKPYLFLIPAGIIVRHFGGTPFRIAPTAFERANPCQS